MLRLVALLCLPLAVPMANGATLTFDTNNYGPSYTEAGMTIERLPDTGMEVFVDSGVWGYPIPSLEIIGLPGGFRLSTTGAFDLKSVHVVHLDLGDQITFSGYRENSEVVRTTIKQPAPYNDEIMGYDSYTYDFSGFNGLDGVLVTIPPTVYGDMMLDNLTFAPVPLPAALPLLGLALGVLAVRCRPCRG